MILGFVLQRTVFGRHVRAVGDNEHAALYAGLPIRSVKIWVYTLAASRREWVEFCTPQKITRESECGCGVRADAIAAVVMEARGCGGAGRSRDDCGHADIGILTNMLRLNNVDSNLE